MSRVRLNEGEWVLVPGRPGEGPVQALRAPGLPFDGLTLEGAKAINELLWHSVVRINATEPSGGGSSVGLFEGFALPGGYAKTPWEAAYDARVLTSWGTHRCISASIVGLFEVLLWDRVYFCAEEECGRVTRSVRQDFWWTDEQSPHPVDDFRGYVCRHEEFCSVAGRSFREQIEALL